MIVHIMPWPLTAGGAQRFFADLATAQRDFADVHAICPEGGDFWDDELVGVARHPVRSESQGALMLAEIAPDLIHHHHPSGGWLMGAVRKARETGAYFLGTQHRWRDNLDPARVEGVVPICGPDPGVIRHGVDLRRFCPAPKSPHPALRQAPGTPLPSDGRGAGGEGRTAEDGCATCRTESRFVVGIVGRRSPEKIPASFIDALLRRDTPGVTWRFVGRGIDGPDGRAIERRLRERPGVELVEDVAPDLMPEAYRDLDLLIVPSIWESVSYVALEAMACGVPVAARAVEGLPETLGAAGVLIKTDDELIDAALALRGDPVRREALGRAGRERVERFYDLGRMRLAYAREVARRTAGLIRENDPDLDVSVVIPVWNTTARWIRECLESVAAQSGARFEILVVDDGSDRDETLAELDAWTAVRGVRVIRRRENGGVGPALNDGIRAAHADLIARIDADDVMPPGRLARQAAIMRERPDLTLLAGQMIVCDAAGRAGERTRLRFDPARFIGEQNWAIAHPTVCVRRCAVLRLGGYIGGHAEDFDLWCRLHAAGAQFEVVPDVWAYYRRHGAQQTATRGHGQRARELRRIWSARAGEFRAGA